MQNVTASVVKIRQTHISKAAFMGRLCRIWRPALRALAVFVLMISAAIWGPVPASAQAPADKAAGENAEKNLVEGRMFLQKNGKRAEVKTTASGLQYEILEAGDGNRPGPEDQVQVYYEGKLLDGTVFDSTADNGGPALFEVSNLIPGWTEALQLMREGAAWRLYIPADLAYGPEGMAGAIPPNATLIFDLQLINVVKAPPPNPQVAAMLAEPITPPQCGAMPEMPMLRPDRAALKQLHDEGNRWQDCVAGYIRDMIQAFGEKGAALRQINPASVPLSQRQAVTDYFAEARRHVQKAQRDLDAFQGIPAR